MHFSIYLTHPIPIDIKSLDSHDPTLAEFRNMGGSYSGGGDKRNLPASYGPTVILLVVMVAFALGMLTAKHLHEAGAKISAPTTHGSNV